MDDERIWKVYIHEFPNGKVYIGITSKSVYKRWGLHGSGYNDQKLMERAISKYGWDNILHDIEAIDLTFKEACKMERELIAEYNANDTRYGYNLTAGGEGSFGYHFSEEARKRKSENLKGDKNPFYGKEHSEYTKKIISQKNKGKHAREKHPRARSIYQINIDTNEVIKEYRCISSTPFGESARRHISECCKGTRPTCMGYKWQYVDEPHEFISNWSTLRSVNQIDLKTGKVIKFWESMREALDELNISDSSQVKKCCDGKRKSCGGYGWQYSDEPHPYIDPKPLKKVVQLDKNTGEFIALYESVFDAQDKTGISRKGISHCCGGFSKSYNGFNWEWYENYERMISQ